MSPNALRILFLRRTKLLWITGLGILGAALITAIQPRVYQSRASFEIQAFNENFLNLRDVFPSASLSTETGPYIQTQTELLQQDSVLEAAARKLQVERRPEFQPASKSLGKLRRTSGSLRAEQPHHPGCGRCARPGFAAELANTVAETFIEQGIEGRQRWRAKPTNRCGRNSRISAVNWFDRRRGPACRQEAGRRRGLAYRRGRRESPRIRGDAAKDQRRANGVCGAADEYPAGRPGGTGFASV